MHLLTDDARHVFESALRLHQPDDAASLGLVGRLQKPEVLLERSEVPLRGSGKRIATSRLDRDNAAKLGLVLGQEQHAPRRLQNGLAGKSERDANPFPLEDVRRGLEAEAVVEDAG